MVHVCLWYQDVASQVRGSWGPFNIFQAPNPHAYCEAEFKKVDVNGGGIVLFDECLGRFRRMSHFVTSKPCRPRCHQQDFARAETKLERERFLPRCMDFPSQSMQS